MLNVNLKFSHLIVYTVQSNFHTNGRLRKAPKKLPHIDTLWSLKTATLRPEVHCNLDVLRRPFHRASVLTVDMLCDVQETVLTVQPPLLQVISLVGRM